MLTLSVAVVVVLMSYGMVQLAVLYARRKGYGVMGKPELALQCAAMSRIMLR